jgi:hypothetical protein
MKANLEKSEIVAKLEAAEKKAQMAAQIEAHFFPKSLINIINWFFRWNNWKRVLLLNWPRLKNQWWRGIRRKLPI